MQVQFAPGPGGLVGCGILTELVAGAARSEGLGDHFGGDHAGLHGRVRALDLGEIQGAGVVADQQSSREVHPRL